MNALTLLFFIMAIVAIGIAIWWLDGRERDRTEEIKKLLQEQYTALHTRLNLVEINIIKDCERIVLGDISKKDNMVEWRYSKRLNQEAKSYQQERLWKEFFQDDFIKDFGISAYKFYDVDYAITFDGDIFNCLCKMKVKKNV